MPCQCVFAHVNKQQWLSMSTTGVYEHSPKDKIKQTQMAKHNTTTSPVKLLDN